MPITDEAAYLFLDETPTGTKTSTLFEKAKAYVIHHATTQLEDQWKMGKALVTVRIWMTHGSFKPWLAANVPNRSYATLSRYMRLARLYPNGLPQDADENAIEGKKEGVNTDSAARKQAAKDVLKSLDDIIRQSENEEVRGIAKTAREQFFEAIPYTWEKWLKEWEEAQPNWDDTLEAMAEEYQHLKTRIKEDAQLEKEHQKLHGDTFVVSTI